MWYKLVNYEFLSIINNSSFRFDAKVLLRFVKVMLRGVGGIC